MRCPPRQLKGGRVRLRSKGRVAKYVCLRGAQVLGDKYSTCILGNWDTPVPICIKSGCSHLSVSHGQVLATYRGALVTVHCDPGYSLVGSQSIFCDGTRWNGSAPFCKELMVSAQKWCDFESEDLCGWTHDTNGEFDWRRHNFATPSGHVGTGPSSDHTLGPGLQGHYMYLETSSPRLENDTARLFSPIFPLSNEKSCFIFWYHMFGNTTGTLNVYLHHKETLLLFSQTGNRGDQWLQAVLPLPPMPSSFQIMIEGVRGNGYEGDTAIDDVKLTQGEECIAASDSSEEVNKPWDTMDASCMNRCDINLSDPNWCECTSDCVQSNTCCSDYLQMCKGPTLEPKGHQTTVQPSQESSPDLSSDADMKTTIEPEEVELPDSNVSEPRSVPSLPTTTNISQSTPPTTKLANVSISTVKNYLTNITTPKVTDQLNSTATPATKPIPTTIPTTSSSTAKTTHNTVTFLLKLPPVTKYQTLSNRLQQRNASLQNPSTIPTKVLSTTVEASFNRTKTLAPKVFLSTTSKPATKPISPKLEFKTPPPPIIFRVPTTTYLPTLTPKLNMSTIFTKKPKFPPFIWPVLPTTSNPKYSKNITAEVAKSKNDVLHPVWTNKTFPLPPPWPPLEPVPTVASSKATTKTIVLQRITTSLVTHTGTYKWKSKYVKPKVNPVTEPRAVQEQQLAGDSSQDHIVHLVVLVSGVLLILLSILASVCVVRRRKINRRNNEDDDLDIRFLASDEMLDFTLARPSPVRETAR